MNNDELNIVYIIDDNKQQQHFLKMSIDTLLSFNKTDRLLIMYYNVTEDYLRELLNCFDINIEYFEFDSSLIKKTFPELPNVLNARLYYPSLSRWWITEIIPYNKFWYVDADVLFNSSIRKDWLEVQKNDDVMMFGYNGTMFSCSVKIQSPNNLLNAGILYFNKTLMQQNNVFQCVVEFYSKNYETIKLVNQTCYEYLFTKLFDSVCKLEISDEYNIRIHDDRSFDLWKDKVKVFHFFGHQKNPIDRIYNKIKDNIKQQSDHNNENSC